MHPPRVEIELLDEADITPPVFHDLRFALHRGEASRKTILFRFLDLECTRQRTGVHWNAGLFQDLQDCLPTGDRVFVAGGFALPMRIRVPGRLGGWLGGRFLVLILQI